MIVLAYGLTPVPSNPIIGNSFFSYKLTPEKHRVTVSRIGVEEEEYVASAS